jgi:hypothetical protein
MRLVQHGDLLIRNQTPQSAVARFVVIDALSRHLVSGPFESLRDATLAAARHADGGTIWQENLDHRGRAVGAPMRLPIRTERRLPRSA